MTAARPLFHVSRVHLGDQVLLAPRQPEAAVHPERGLPERVCFAPTVAHCLASMSGARVSALVIGEAVPRRKRIEGEWCHANPSVYQTRQRLRRPPQDRSDFARTGERWSLRPIRVSHAGFVCLATLTREGVIRLVSTPWSPAKAMSQAYQGWEEDFLDR